MQNDSPLFVIGDIHGHYDTLVRLVRDAGLANSDARWTGGDAKLWFMGDFTDRGPDGIGAIDFVMRLQQDAARKGGQVGSLLGNHDVGILSAKLFAKARTNGPRKAFFDDWVANGGLVYDLERLNQVHIEWIRNLPALAVVNHRLLMHADALFYLHYGATVAQVNAAIRELMHNADTERWDALLGYASQRLEFSERRSGGVTRAAQALAYFGGRQIIHGHTPIPMLSGEPISHITHAHAYCQGLVVDVDGGIYKGGKGFVYQAPPLDLSLTTNLSVVEMR